MSDTVSEIKSKLHIADVLRGYINLIPAGKNLKALCPFHKEKTPSFMVSPEREGWYCFGCAEGGDMFKFVMKYENLEFFEAMKVLAEKAGVEVQAVAGGGEAFKEIYDIQRITKDYFVGNLWNNPSAHRDYTVSYLKERGLKEETVREFEIGLSTTASDDLLRHLVGQKKQMRDIERAGVVFKSASGTYWDRFRSRLVFPLYNNFGKVIGFTGRVLPSAAPMTGFDSAKYVNSPETPIFHKSKVLYGFHKSKSHIRDAHTVIVVEGQMDFLMMWQDGLKNVIASSGTALTPEHLENLRRLADHIILCFDADEAGQAAAERSIDLANSLDFDVKLIEIKGDYKDPADVVKAAPGKMAEFVAGAQPAMGWYFDRYLKGATDIVGKKNGINLVLEKIKRLGSPIVREHYLRELSLRTGSSESALREAMAAIAVAPDFKKSVLPPLVMTVKSAAERRAHRDVVAESLLTILYLNPAKKSLAIEARAHLSPDYQILFDALSETGFGTLPDSLTATANLISLKSSFTPTSSGTKALDDELHTLLSELKSENLKSRREELRQIIAVSERDGNVAGLAEALKEFDLVSKALHNL